MKNRDKEEPQGRDGDIIEILSDNVISVDESIQINNLVTSSSRRKRRVKDKNGDWVDNLPINYSEPDYFPQLDYSLPDKKRKHKKGNDPSHLDFQLVPLSVYRDETAPFSVSVSCLAMVNHKIKILFISKACMDLHAHLWKTEVIGLLGGHYLDSTHEIIIHDVYFCNSISTTIQCEMDPISEMNAREYFSCKDLIIVGWYHSHPTFEPTPSIRDIETQVAYQVSICLIF
jgi:protein MYSM1